MTVQLARCTECDEIHQLGKPGHHCWDKCIGGAEDVTDEEVMEYMKSMTMAQARKLVRKRS